MNKTFVISVSSYVINLYFVKNKLLRTVPPNTEEFLQSLRLCGKSDLSMGYWQPERKLEAVGYFLEIIKQQLLL